MQFLKMIVISFSQGSNLCFKSTPLNTSYFCGKSGKNTNQILRALKDVLTALNRAHTRWSRYPLFLVQKTRHKNINCLYEFV